MGSWEAVYQWGGVILGIIACITLVIAIAGGKRKRGDF